MNPIADCVVALRISGDALEPDSITRRIGSSPTDSHRKGDVESLASGHQVVRNKGLWLLEAVASKPEDLESQARDVLARLTQDIGTWQALAREFEIDLCCGVFMSGSNDGLELSSSTLLALGERGIGLSLHLYAPTREVRAGDPCPCESGETYGQCCGSWTGPQRLR